MTDIVFRFFLTFSHETIILPIVLIGYTLQDRTKWSSAVYIMLFTMVLSQFLKDLWKIPLPAHIDPNGYAFPSGHMQMAATFYGYLMLQYKHIAVRASCSLIIIMVGLSLMHFGYHELRDILGGLGFAALTIASYHYIHKHYFKQHHERVGALLSVIGCVLIISMSRHKSGSLIGEGALVGFTIGRIFAANNNNTKSIIGKVLCLMVSIAGVGVIKFVSTFAGASYSALLIVYGATGLWVAVAPYLRITVR